jgi:hypothetical protein
MSQVLFLTIHPFHSILVSLLCREVLKMSRVQRYFTSAVSDWPTTYTEQHPAIPPFSSHLLSSGRTITTQTMANTARTYKNTLASSKPGEKKTRGRPPKKCAVASSNSGTTKRTKRQKPSCTVKNTLASSKPGEKKKPGRPHKNCAVAYC